ncbi:MAG: iron-sulfur cluster assembly scaffold protein [Parcubacteria group bacterium CG08_land_8_20_14_0_20_38_56]|nr:MAG: iron-sulfur cluster assembly scaffold protein [Parcubacteria group bacterium CG08_land_8_20_14_0_20_38_56]
MYSKKVLRHFLHPKHMGRIKNPDGVGQAGNIICGDTMELYLKIKMDKKKKKEVIKDLKFQTIGCAAAISSSDVACELLKGKTLEQALKLKPEDIIKKLGGLPEVKVHCSLLGVEALKSAIKNYLERK